MSFSNPYQQPQRTTFNTNGYNNLPSLHEQSAYRTQQPPILHPQQQQQQQQQSFRHDTTTNLPPPLQLNTTAEQYHQPLPSLYESRKLFQCNEPGCSEYFDHSNGLRIHQRTAHGRNIISGEEDTRPVTSSAQTRPYVCPYAECGKSFTQYGNLKTHSRKHTGERPYQCSYEGCDKAFTQLGNLKTHEKIHWPVKPFMCAFPNCGKGFTQRGNLKTHQVKVHQIAPQ